MNVWKALFNRSDTKGKVGGPLSPAQCDAARAVFGGAIPDLEARCAKPDYAGLAKQAYKAVMDEPDIAARIDAVVNDITEMANQLKTVDDGITALERAAAEKRFLSPRLSRSLMSDDDAWFNPVAIGHKSQPAESAGGDWVDSMSKYGLKAGGPRNQHFSNYLMQGWYKKSWF